MFEAQTPFAVSCGDYTIACAPAGLPGLYDAFKQHARLAEEIGLDASVCCVWVTRSGDDWPALVVAQGGVIHGAGFGIGALLVPETKVLFWSWTRHDDVVVMSAELELAAWDTSGRKLWTTFVEPPWSYAVTAGAVELDVMGTKSRFPLRTGPATR